MMVFVKSLTNKTNTNTLIVQLFDTTANVKPKIQDKFDIPPVGVALIKNY